MSSFIAGYYQVSVWITRFAYLNLLWFVFSVAGLVLFGFLPATAAMFAVVRKWINKEHEVPIFQTFWQSYRKEFIKINLIGYVIFAVGYFLTIEFQILRAQEHIGYIIASFGVLGLFLIYLIILLYLFPIFVHFKLRPLEYIKWAFLIGIGHPILTIFLLGVMIGILYLAYTVFPALLFFFGGSISAYILMWGASQTFTKFERAGA
ncbi:YesL family protein [Gracilibacillus alcaliphilus]|uniref:YesL family protein n=1 Tax=Gracilibacillus alcaliphilus TaxID=1401441 RepID=UPI00195962DA|nr:DUF624 domain-containing protein [Gracilibacillus alcaliphilus]MBM7676987.1 putative membrane protein YesL [Gracilibacillus alcaliphilus]